MSFNTWYKNNKAGWDSVSDVSGSITQRTNSYTTNNGFPLDYRTLRQTYAQAIQLGGSARYPGLKVYVINEDTEYVFKLTDPDTMAMDNAGTLKEYHPELAHVKTQRPVKTYDANDDPVEYYSDEEILADPTLALGDGIINNTYQTIPEGVEGAYKTSDGKYYKFVWNGSAWVTYANSGSSTQGDGANNNSSIILNFTTSDAASINGLNSGIITSAYRTKTGTGSNDPIPTGTEVMAIFSNNGVDTARKYIWINGAWFIIHGSQEYIITLPAYASWDNNYSPNLGANFTVSKTETEGVVNLVIAHQFDSQYIDAFVFARGTGDKDGDGQDDTYGERILATVTCLDSNDSGVFKVRIPLPVSKTTATTYAITLQK